MKILHLSPPKITTTKRDKDSPPFWSKDSLIQNQRDVLTPFLSQICVYQRVLPHSKPPWMWESSYAREMFPRVTDENAILQLHEYQAFADCMPAPHSQATYGEECQRLKRLSKKRVGHLRLLKTAANLSFLTVLAGMPTDTFLAQTFLIIQLWVWCLI